MWAAWVEQAVADTGWIVSVAFRIALPTHKLDMSGIGDFISLSCFLGPRA